MCPQGRRRERYLRKNVGNSVAHRLADAQLPLRAAGVDFF